MPTPPMPGWNDPVATGTRSPIFKVAFCPSSARICGFWMILVSLSLNNAVADACGIVTWKSVAFRLARVFRLMLFVDDEPELGVPVGFVDEPEVLTLGCSVTEALVGGLIPSLCARSRLTCITATSISTWGLA